MPPHSARPELVEGSRDLFSPFDFAALRSGCTDSGPGMLTMSKPCRLLYVSYDGMTDSLGQSQVIPYLVGLAAHGHQIHLLSCEKPERFQKSEGEIRNLLASHNIIWHPIAYHKRPPILSTVWDIDRLKRAAISLHHQHAFELLHCRSYIAAMVGLLFKQRFGVRFIFDMRGFYADERVDGGLWKLNNPIYRAVYHYFKAREREFLLAADQIVTLTHLAREEILRWALPGKTLQIEVIPCCVDLDHFSRAKVTTKQQQTLRASLGLNADDFVVTYLGSIGTWYMLPEMLQFFVALTQHQPRAKFFFITPDDPTQILETAARAGIAADRLIIVAATRSEVPPLLSLSTIGLFFIKPTYSKMASSPTKLGELLSMGIPVVMNANVGDSKWIHQHFDIGETVDGFTQAEYQRVIANLEKVVALSPTSLRHAAEAYFSLSRGVDLYRGIYDSATEPLVEQQGFA